MKNKIKEFIKNNKILFLGLILCLGIVISYEVTKNMQEWFQGADFIYYLFVQIAFAYIGSFVFFIIQVYIPETKTKSRIKSCIKRPVGRIIYNMECPIEHFKNQIFDENEKIDNMKEDDFIAICDSINPFEEAPMIFLNGNKGTNRDYIYEHILKVEDNFNQISNYIAFIDSELIAIIDGIINSRYHERFKSYCRIGGKNENLDFMAKNMNDYYDKLRELKRYAQINDLI